MTKKEIDYLYYHTKGYKERLKQKRKENPEFFRERERLWRQKTPERGKGKILQKYWPGSTWKQALENFNVMVDKQSNLCAICKQPEKCLYNKPPHTGKIRDLCVDHCHITGKVRGLLCDDCNVLLGRAKDNVDVCLSAAEYLKEAA